MPKKILWVTVMLALFVITSCTGNKVRQTEEKENNMFEAQIVTEDNSVISTSGEYILEMLKRTVDGIPSCSFSVKDKGGLTLYECDDSFRLRDTVYILWGDHNTVWVYSGDVGTFYWEESDDGWVRKSYIDNKDNVVVPEVLKQLRPEYYN